MKEIRVGNGFDVHKLCVGKKIKLCGVEIKNNKRNETVNNRCLLFSLKSNNFCIYILHKLTFWVN